MARRVVTRREVLNLSANLFANQGYRSTSLAHVAERLGVTRQALYYHFKSKGQILAALFEEVMTKLESAVAAVPDEVPPGGEARFSKMLRAHIDVTLANADLVALLLHERPEMARLKDLQAAKRRREYAGLFFAAYHEGVRTGELVDIDPVVAVNTLISAVNGVSSWYHGEAPNGNATAFKENLMALLTTGYFTTQVAAPATA